MLPPGCFHQLLLSDSEIDEHYNALPFKPQFKIFKASNDREVYYAETGADTLPLILFIHGAPGAWHYYMEYMDDTALQKRAHLISVDRPGYGRSNYGKSLTSIHEQARLLHEIIMARSNNQPVIVVGRSYGGPIAARIAMDYPNDVDALVMLAPALDPVHEKFWWFSKPVKCAPLCWLMPKSVNVASEEKFSHVKELEEMLPLWDSVQTPTTVVQGSADAIVDTANFSFAKRVLRKAKNRRFIWLEGVSHYVADERPALVKEIITSYADSLSRH
jgi:pimeloyl-ACP methyl ester carboxylesterase